MAQSSQAKGKETMSIELSGDVQLKAKSGFNNQESKFPPKQYSFKDEWWSQYSIYSTKGIN